MQNDKYVHKIEVEKDIEETFELMGYVDTDCLVNDFMDNLYIEDVELSEEDKVDAHCDKIVFAINAIEALGYDAEQCMSETIMEISSRRQCPIQKEEWNNSGKSGKWQKDKSQTDTYTAKYSECKRN